MKVIINVYTNEVIAISSVADKVENGYDMGYYILAEPMDRTIYKVYDVAEIPQDIKPLKYCYDGTLFTLNPNYIEPFNGKVELEQLKKENETLGQLVSQGELERLEMAQTIANMELEILSLKGGVVNA